MEVGSAINAWMGKEVAKFEAFVIPVQNAG